MLKAKIHGATVTDASVEYEGSITVDGALMRAVGMVPYEAVQVWSLTTGERLETYLLEGEEGSGMVCVNGAAAHRIKKGERIILTCFSMVHANEARNHRPSVVVLDEGNRIALPRGNHHGPAQAGSMEEESAA
jgi:aspartate 1-decarboxylase